MSVILTVAVALLICVPYVFTVHVTYEKHVANELNNKNEYFSDVATMGKQHILDSLEKMTERVKDAGTALSFFGTDRESMESFFTKLYFSTEADEGLIFSSDGSVTYGNREYGSLFLETAREAESSGGSSVSEFVECSDGVKRIGIAAPFTAADGGTNAVMLLYSQATLELMLENLNLSDEGSLCIFDSNGSLILCESSEQNWLEEGQYTVGKTGDLKEQLFTVTATEDGKQYSAFAKPVGINNWFVVYAAPTEQTAVQLKEDITRINVLGACTMLLIMALLAFGIYRGNLNLHRMELFKKKFRIATSQSARAAFEYNRRTDQLTFISDSEHVKLPKPYISLSELSNLVHPADRAAYMQSVSELRGKGSTSTTVRVFNFCGREVYRWYHVTATLLTNKGEGKAITIGTVEDIDERENERLVLHEKATTDCLTGLWNRAETEKVVNERLSRLETKEHSVFAIFDLDDFKDINDDFGHDCGDKALIYFAEKLRSTFRFGDVLGRLGGDEFVVYMTLTAEKEIVERRLKELMQNMLSGINDNDPNAPKISCSIGCCIASKGDTFDCVYKRADNALYESKTRGKQQFTIVD